MKTEHGQILILRKNISVCDEAVLEYYLEQDRVEKEQIVRLISRAQSISRVILDRR